MKRKLEVILSKYTGYCFGVKRAMKLIDEGLAVRSGRIFSLGDVIHNPQAVERLRSRGVVGAVSMEEMGRGDNLIIRAHGVGPEILEEADRRGISLIDTTCPFVMKSHNHVMRMSREGRKVVVIGDGRHPEVQGIAGRAGSEPLIIRTVEEAEDIEGIERAGVVTQTTFSRDKALSIIEVLRDRIPDLEVNETICEATRLRRDSTRELARSVDMILIVGGRNSSNTRELYQMCLDEGIPSKFIETAEEIEPSWFEGLSSVGIATGTSTPHWVIDGVLSRLEQWNRSS